MYVHINDVENSMFIAVQGMHQRKIGLTNLCKKRHYNQSATMVPGLPDGIPICIPVMTFCRPWSGKFW
jgi:hypothetical protein